ncbi:MAG: UvrD-helicase domain-containing protein [Deltaproteobacteria bacterium]|nr:UvrD-helicase domain-containing protein [Deltaproteobacteria bacterium]
MNGLKTHIPDEALRQEALDPSRSFIVQAPAGSGKTELLITRYLKLLGLSDSPEEVLAITFTRKAAGEMRSRVLGLLEKAAPRTPPIPPLYKGGIGGVRGPSSAAALAGVVLKRDEEKGWKILENPGRLKIQTIDSLSASIAGRLPVLSGLGGSHGVADDPEDLYIEAAKRTIAMIKEKSPAGEAARTALFHLDNSAPALVGRLVLMLGKRDQWLRHIPYLPPFVKGDKGGLNLHHQIPPNPPLLKGVTFDEAALKHGLEGSLKRLVAACLKKALEAFPKGLVPIFAESASYAAKNLINAGSNRLITNLKNLEALPAPSAKELGKWKGLCEFLLTSDGRWRTARGVNETIGFPNDKKSIEAIEMKKSFQDLLQGISSNQALYKGLLNVRRLPEPRYEARDWEILKALLRLLPVADGLLKEVFLERGEVDYQSVAMAAIRALGTEQEPTDLMLALDLRLRHILVDEYQDTSVTQKFLLEALTRGWEAGDGRTLFLVGDPMQSIYLFREAQVGLFLQARAEGLGGIRLVPITLASNFRSHETVVGWVNSVFKGAFPEDEDPFMGRMPYAPSIAVNTGGSAPGVNMTVYLKNGHDDNETLNSEEAHAIASMIKAVPAGETIGVLGRARSHLKSLVAELKRQGMDFRSEKLDPLSSRPVVCDLVSLLRALMHPRDRVAWLAVLRAPWCGLTVKDLHALCLGAGESFTAMPELMNDALRVKSLSADGQARLQRVSATFEKALMHRGRLAPAKLIEGVWLSLGGPSCYSSPDTLNDAQEFFALLESSSEGGLVRSMDVFEARIKKLFACRSAATQSPAEVMTIHKAKGLEFDHVFIAGAGKRPQTGEKKLLLWLEKGDDLLLAPIERKGNVEEGEIYGYIKAVYSEKEALENIRLFYVAATRAKKALYIFGHVKGPPQSPPCARGGLGGSFKTEPKSLLSVIAHAIGPGSFRGLPAPVPPLCKGGTGGVRLKSGWTQPAAEAPLPSEGTAPSSVTADVGPAFDWAKRGIRCAGVVVHRYLMRICRDGVDKWGASRLNGEKANIQKMLMQAGLSRAEAAKMADLCLNALKRALNDEKGRWALGRHAEAREEFPLTGVVNGRAVRAVIDRTFVDEDGVRWVIDYKASEHRGGELDGFLIAEKARYEAQLETYGSILRALGEERPIKKGLYYPALGAWIEW